MWNVEQRLRQWQAFRLYTKDKGITVVESKSNPSEASTLGYISNIEFKWFFVSTSYIDVRSSHMTLSASTLEHWGVAIIVH